MYRILTIPFDPEIGGFPDEALRRFASGVRIESSTVEFFQYEDVPYWSVFIEYEPLVPGKEATGPSATGLNRWQKLLLAELRKWRTETARTEGIPPYVVATNRVLTELALRAPRNLEELKLVKGFGEKRRERHGKELLERVNAFFKES